MKLEHIRKPLLILVASAFTLAGVAALAHHGRGPYAQENVTIEGATVQRFLYVNPHTQLQFTAPDNGSEAEWVAEAGSPNQLLRLGIYDDIVAAGDKISVTGFPHDSRPRHLLLESITLANGEQVMFRGPNAGYGASEGR